MPSESCKRTCPKCGKLLPIDTFYRNGRGYINGRCKHCISIDHKAKYKADPVPVLLRCKEYRERNAEAGRERSRRYRKEHKEVAYASVTRWVNEHPEAVAFIKKRSYEKHKKEVYTKTKRRRELFPEKGRANALLATAVRNGKVKKLPCEVCGNIRSVGHHEDYSEPLAVVWLCYKHHRQTYLTKGRSLL